MSTEYLDRTGHKVRTSATLTRWTSTRSSSGTSDLIDLMERDCDREAGVSSARAGPIPALQYSPC